MKKFILAFLVVLLSACSQIDMGSVGVSSFAGKTEMEELTPGWKVTWFNTVTEVSVREMTMQLQDMKPKTRDNLTLADFDVDIYFRIDPTKVAETIIKYQGDLLKDQTSGNSVVGWNRVSRSAREAAYTAASKYDALTLHQNRATLANDIRTMLQAELNTNDKDVFVVTDVNVRAIVTDPALEKSNQEKVARDNQIQSKLKEVELARAEAERQLVEAQGQAAANEVISRSLTPQLLRLKELEAQRAFATQGTHTVLMGSNTSASVLVGK